MKKGFTLVELLGVIAIVALITLLVAPKITERFGMKQEEASDTAKDILYAATREYISSNQYLFNTNESYYCISIKTLVDDGKLVEPVIDVKTGSNLDLNKTIKVTIQNEQYHFEYDNDSCRAS